MATVTTSQQTLPGPRALPLLGGWRANLLKLYLDPFAYLSWLHTTYGNVVALQRGNPAYVCAFGPEMNFHLLANPDVFETSAAPMVRLPRETALGRLFYNGLPLMRGERHKQHRRLMLPAFHKRQIAHYHNDMVLLTEQMMQRWQTGSIINVLTAMRDLTQRIAVKTLFGIYDEAEITHMGMLLRKLAMVPLALFLPINIPGLPYARLLHLAEQMEDFTRSVITQKRFQADATDVMAALVHAHDEDGTRLSDDELISNAFTLYVAGHETTSHALTWTLFLLDQHPRILANLLEELGGVLHGSVPTPEQLMHLPLLDAVMKESLRLLPPAALGVRVTLGPGELGGFELPEGSSVVYSQYLTHRLPELYEEPSRFKPERWATLVRNTYEYLPFSAGHHRCIGAEFAMYEIKVVLSMVLQRYRLSLVPNTRVGTNVAMRPSTMPMRIFKQDRQCERVPVRGGIRRLVDLSREATAEQY